MNKKKFSLLKLLLIILIIALLIYVLLFLLNKNNDDNNTQRAGYYTSSPSSYGNSWIVGSNIGQLNSSVASGVRAKRTEILGNDLDNFTIMVYMCGSDLESEASMAVYDLVEMSKANLGNNIKLVIFAGGTTNWHADGLSNSHNQILEVINGRVTIVEENAGNAAMVDPDTLSSFIEYADENYPANRKALIFWDHGGGSVTGYGHDERFPRAGTMSLAGIDQALTEADVQFDFIGFDTCLMGNTETALMIAEHADYLIASEESEPGVGWYYTDWLNNLGRNPSMPTLQIGKNIVDSFVSQCKKDTPRQSATLAVIDLAEMQDIIPSKLSAFSKATTNLLETTGFRQIANARSGAREFASQSYVDLVDLVDLASRVGNKEAEDLVSSLLSCIKYNNTTSDMTNSYGLSIYFPYRSTKYVNTVLKTYDGIDMNEDYSKCIRSFASYAASGQLASGGTHNAYNSYNSYSSNNYYSNQSSTELLFSLLDMFMGGGYSNNNSYSSYYSTGLDFLFRDNNKDKIVEYIVDNHFSTDLTFKNNKIKIQDKDWDLIDQIKLNMFIDDGNGYIDLGKDNIFEIDDKGNLLALNEKTWLTISKDNTNYQVVPYYYQYEIVDGDNITSYGYIPILLNDKLAKILIQINDDINITGITYDYEDNDIVPKTLVELNNGDVIKFICDYYDYDGNYSASHVLGNPLTYEGNLSFGDIDISSYKPLASYEIKDIYQQSYWTTPMK